ncbi:hypothetical protein L1987_35860 [Smallanthus sonchifolius]|uniref:Uncharacterized protein n=1 Tax=Smallanthus sonchifolius TaxID=185202 RepID=A0ACB9HBV2_9ASTR|nr:hypothetical protein L1987_35860 [Smallanthus sonchifolius]
MKNGVYESWSVHAKYGPLLCLDNRKAIKSLKPRRHMEHRERYCPKPNSRCLIRCLCLQEPIGWIVAKQGFLYEKGVNDLSPSRLTSLKQIRRRRLRLKSKPLSLSTDQETERVFHEDTKHWSELVTNVYIAGLGVNWSSMRNVTDMNAVAMAG